MQFKQFKDGSCDIFFSEEEINIIKNNKKLHLSDIALKHFGNTLVKVVVEWQDSFNKKVKNLKTYPSDNIKKD